MAFHTKDCYVIWNIDHIRIWIHYSNFSMGCTCDEMCVYINIWSSFNDESCWPVPVQNLFFWNLWIYLRVGRTPWTGDRPDERPHTYIQDNTTQKNADRIHASSGIRIHDPSVRAAEDSTCLRPRGHWDRHVYIKLYSVCLVRVKIDSYLQ